VSQESSITVQDLRDQLMQQQSQIEFQSRQLQDLQQRGVPEATNTSEVQMSETPNLYDLPIRPTYEWTTSTELASSMPSRQQISSFKY
jgi:hypothetical protein